MLLYNEGINEVRERIDSNYIYTPCHHTQTHKTNVNKFNKADKPQYISGGGALIANF